MQTSPQRSLIADLGLCGAVVSIMFFLSIIWEIMTGAMLTDWLQYVALFEGVRNKRLGSPVWTCHFEASRMGL